jgi:hypothetical protein
VSPRDSGRIGSLRPGHAGTPMISKTRWFIARGSCLERCVRRGGAPAAGPLPFPRGPREVTLRTTKPPTPGWACPGCRSLASLPLHEWEHHLTFTRGRPVGQAGTPAWSRVPDDPTPGPRALVGGGTACRRIAARVDAIGRSDFLPARDCNPGKNCARRRQRGAMNPEKRCSRLGRTQGVHGIISGILPRRDSCPMAPGAGDAPLPPATPNARRSLPLPSAPPSRCTEPARWRRRAPGG